MVIIIRSKYVLLIVAIFLNCEFTEPHLGCSSASSYQDDKYRIIESTISKSDYFLRSPSLTNDHILRLKGGEDSLSDQSDIDTYTDGIIESDIETDSQFVLPDFAKNPVDLPIGGFINHQQYAAQSPRDVSTLKPPIPPIVVTPKLNPDWFRPEMNPDFASSQDRRLQHQRSLSLAAERKINKKRRQQNQSYYGVAIKQGKEFYHPYSTGKR